MFKKAIVFAVAAACLASGAAFAQSADYRYDGVQRSERQDRYDGESRYDRGDRQSSRGDYGRDYRRDYRRDYGRDYRRDGYRDGYYSRSDYRQDGYRGQRHQMRRGERMSQYNSGSYYVVSDWRRHRLQAPRRGHHWVQHGNDFALVAITSGIIAQVLMNH